MPYPLRLLQKYGSAKLFNVEKSVLIFSTHAAFAELSRLSLAENTPYNVKTALTIDEMQTLINRSEFDLVILDADFPNETLLNFVSTLQEQHPGPGYLVFPPDNQTGHADLEKIHVDAQLLKPFYLPDFLNAVEKVLNAGVMKSDEPDQPEPVSDIANAREESNWLSIPDWYDPAKIGDQLDQALEGSKAQGAFILSVGGSAVYRGKLNYTAVSEISDFLLDKVDLENKSDIVRFMPLKADEMDHLIYAISFREHHLLVMIFEKTIPFTMARSNVRQVEYTLNEIIASQESGKEQPVQEEISTSGQITKFDEQRYTEINSEEISPEEVEMMKVSQLIDQVSGKDPQASDNDSAGVPSDQTEISPELPDWLTDPGETKSETSEPESETEFDDTLQWVKEEDQPETILNRFEDSNNGEELLKDLVFPWDEKYVEPESQDGVEIEAESSSIERVSEIQTEQPDEMNEFDRVDGELEEVADESGFELIEEEADLYETMEEQVESPHENLEQTSILEEEPFAEDRREATVTEIKKQELPESLIKLAPVKAGLSHLNYTCVLVPRFPQHFLVGDMAKRISEWIPQLCIAFGWRLERLSVRPKYIQWTVIVDPNIAPDKLIKIFRKETSKRLFKIWPDYELENPSKDFWAPGYLILSGYCPPTQEALADFVNQTRIRQGIQS